MPDCAGVACGWPLADEMRACVCFTVWLWDTISALPRGAHQRLQVVKVALEGTAAASRQSILRLGHPAREGFRARDVFGFLELARVDAEIAVGRLHQLLEITEAERIVDGQRADDAEAEAFVNEPVQRVGASRGKGAPIRFASNCPQISCHAWSPVVARGSVLSHRASTRQESRSRCGGRRTPPP